MKALALVPDGFRTGQTPSRQSLRLWSFFKIHIPGKPSKAAPSTSLLQKSISSRLYQIIGPHLQCAIVQSWCASRLVAVLIALGLWKARPRREK